MFLTPMWPYVTFDPTGVTWHVKKRVSVLLTKFRPDRSLSVRVMAFLMKINIWPMWPHMTPCHQKQHTLYQRSLATSCAWVAWWCNVTLRIRSISRKNHLFDPMWPLCDLDPTGVTCHVGVRVSVVVTKFGQDRLLSVGIKVILVKINIWPVWPHVTPDHQKKLTLYQRSLATSYTWVAQWCNVTLRTRSIFSENHMFDPCDPCVTFDPTGVTRHVGVGISVVVTKFG